MAIGFDLTLLNHFIIAHAVRPPDRLVKRIRDMEYKCPTKDSLDFTQADHLFEKMMEKIMPDEHLHGCPGPVYPEQS